MRQLSIKDYDFRLVFLVLLLTVLGIIAVGSAKESVQNKQIMGAAMGFILMIIISVIDYNFVLKFYWGYYILNMVFLVLVTTSIFGSDSHGAQRWINLFGITFQPSEPAKIFLILFFAQFLHRNAKKFKSFLFYVFCFVLILIPVYEIHEQPDLSTSIVVMVVFAVMMFVSGFDLRFLLGTVAVIVPTAIIILYLILQPDSSILEDYQKNRILAFLNPTAAEYVNDDAYQQNNSVMAIGSGQLLGKGYSQGEVNSVQGGGFISEPQTDFIFAVIGEEWGFIGASAIIILLFAIALECAFVAKRASNLAGKLLACGVSAMIGFQGFMNLAVCTQLMPVTGLTLPFVSYGLTSLISCYAGIGFVLNVRLQGKQIRAN
ncbi:MAG: rod shape-determining protein RodA [Lachnospiraceae bacterium]|nr:rod shape-determining protein RodA [Lachnospiraceae bacterium]